MKIKNDHVWLKTDVDLHFSQGYLINVFANASNQNNKCNLLCVDIKNKWIIFVILQP